MDLTAFFIIATVISFNHCGARPATDTNNNGGEPNGALFEEPNSIQLNGQNSHIAPPWPQHQLPNETMFLLPKVLATYDRIKITGNTTRRDTLSIGLVTGYNGADYQNVACQVDAKFETDQTSIKIIKNGNEVILNADNTTSSLFVDEKFEVEFVMREEGRLGVILQGAYLETVTLEHNIDSIRYLTVYGDVKLVRSLDFQFGKDV